mgnify:CR=1 FL=1
MIFLFLSKEGMIEELSIKYIPLSLYIYTHKHNYITHGDPIINRIRVLVWVLRIKVRALVLISRIRDKVFSIIEFAKCHKLPFFSSFLGSCKHISLHFCFFLFKNICSQNIAFLPRMRVIVSVSLT